MQSWLNLLQGSLFSTLNLAFDQWTDRSPFWSSYHLGEDYVVSSYWVLPEGFQPPSIIGEIIVLVPLDDRSMYSLIWLSKVGIYQSSLLKYQIVVFCDRNRRELDFLGRLSLDQHRTAFSFLYETRTHPFGVAATETDLEFRNHYTLWYKLLVSVELPAGLNGCLHLELTYSFGFTGRLAGSQHLHITGG